jgi:hypothetical protein
MQSRAVSAKLVVLLAASRGRQMGPPNTTVVREARAPAVGRIAGCLMFVAGALLVAPHLRVVRRIEVLAAGGFFAIISLRYCWTVVRPGYLLISAHGVEQDLGWRKRSWSWDQIQDVRLVRTVPTGKRFPTRLFGWTLPPCDIERVLRQMRPEATATPISPH